MATDWVEKSTKRVGPSPRGLVKSERPSSVLTNKRHSAGQSSKSWRTCSRRNLTPWKSCEWPRRPRNVFLGVRYLTVSAQLRDIQESAPLFRAKGLPVRDRARAAAA